MKQSNGRNIINADMITDTLLKRLEERQLTPCIKKWMTTKYRKWLINTYPNIQAIKTSQEYRQLMQSEPPDWFKQSFNDIGKKPPSFIDLQLSDLLLIEGKLCEVLVVQFTAATEKKMFKYSVEDLLRKWEQDHEQFIVNGKPLVKTSGKALSKVDIFDGYTIYQLLDQEELKQELHNESVMMGHCVGSFENTEEFTGGYGQYYYDQITNNKVRIYTLRDKQHRSHVTLSFYQDGKIEQIKGKQNRVPVQKYIPAIIDFLNHLGAGSPDNDDLGRLGVGYEYGLYKPIELVMDRDVLFYLIHLNGELLTRVEERQFHPMLGWAALLNNRSNIQYIPEQSITPEQQIFIKDTLPPIINIHDPEVQETNSFNWVKQLSQNFVIRMGGDHILFGLHPDQNGLGFEKEIMEDSWGVTDNKSAIETLNWLYTGGHIKNFKPNAAKPHLTARSVLAFDITRLMYVTRSAYYCGFIDESTAWSYCILHAYIAQSCFDDLSDYYFNYLYGREFWGETGDDVRKEISIILLGSHPYSSLGDIPWEYPLDFSGSYAPTSKRRYKPKIDPIYYASIAEFYERDGNYAESLRFYQKAYALSKEVKQLRKIAFLFYQLDNDKQALKHINQVLRQQPDDPTALKTKAQILCFSENSNHSRCCEAFDLQKKAAYIAQNAYHFKQLAYICKALNQNDQAIRYFKHALSIDINNGHQEDILYELVYLLYKNNNDKEASTAATYYLKHIEYDDMMDMLVGACKIKAGCVLEGYHHYIELSKKDNLSVKTRKMLLKNIRAIVKRQEIAHLNLPIIED